MLLNSYVKLAHVFPELESEVQSVLEIHTDNVDPDLQQRAIEYLALLEDDDEVIKARKLALKKMPCFSEKIQANNPLLKKILALKLGKDMKDEKVIEETHQEMMRTKEIKKVQKMLKSMKVEEPTKEESKN